MHQPLENRSQIDCEIKIGRIFRQHFLSLPGDSRQIFYGVEGLFVARVSDMTESLTIYFSQDSSIFIAQYLDSFIRREIL